MKTKKKALLLVMCALLLVGATVMGTLAYLTDTTGNEVKNTFTVGKVIIDLHESELQADGTLDTSKEVKGNNYTSIVPGVKYLKDPTITVDESTEDCWIFVKITNEFSAIETTTEADTIDAQVKAKGWKALDGNAGVYYKSYVKGTTDKTLPVFDSFTIDGETKDVSAYDGKTIVITGYAIQTADEFDTEEEIAAAWAAVQPASGS